MVKAKSIVLVFLVCGNDSRVLLFVIYFLYVVITGCSSESKIYGY
jgi:hypothetical protein